MIRRAPARCDIRGGRSRVRGAALNTLDAEIERVVRPCRERVEYVAHLGLYSLARDAFRDGVPIAQIFAKYPAAEGLVRSWGFTEDAQAPLEAARRKFLVEKRRNERKARRRLKRLQPILNEQRRRKRLIAEHAEKLAQAEQAKRLHVERANLLGVITRWADARSAKQRARKARARDRAAVKTQRLVKVRASRPSRPLDMGGPRDVWLTFTPEMQAKEFAAFAELMGAA